MKNIKKLRLQVYLRSVLYGSLCSAIFMAACNSEQSSKVKTDTTQQVKVIKTQKGKASFYARSLEGQETTSGEIFSNKNMVAAHPRFPFGTVVRLTNLENLKQVIVKIIDRGPTLKNQREGVIIDLSRAAAKRLDMIEDGRATVKVEVLKWGEESEG